MRILHSALMLSYSPGIYQQMSWEQEASNVLGADLKAKIFCPKGVYPSSDVVEYANLNTGNKFSIKLMNWFLLRKQYYNWLLEQAAHYELILLRYSVHDPFLVSFLSQVDIPVCLVHHTLELPELNSLGIVGKIRAIADKFIGSASISRASGLVAVTNEILEFELSRTYSSVSKKTFIYPNGIFIQNKILNDSRSAVPQILFVASYFFAWHGLDLLLSDLKNNKSEFVLHVVGDVELSDIQIAQDDNRIVFHGKLDSAAIETLMQSCWIGLSSFALDRKGMSEACTLKVREYLSSGLPVYSGHQDVFPEYFPFYAKGLPKFDAILEFCQQTRSISKEQVAASSNQYIDKIHLLDKLMRELQDSNFDAINKVIK